jgi:predicted DNA-binding protein (MmcQ/YjbR family)
MDLAQFREYCLSKPCATEGMPFGPDVLVFKVSGKMFALAALDEVPTTVNLKCDLIRRSSCAIVTSKSRRVIT